MVGILPSSRYFLDDGKLGLSKNAYAPLVIE